MDISEFDLHARLEDVHWWFKARREIMLAALEKYVPPSENRMIVEIGCGTGGNLKFFRNHYRVAGVDVSPEAVRYASARIDVPVYLGDFRSVLSGLWRDIDAVILADVLEHVDDDKSFLRDIVHSLKHGAVLLITVPAHQFLWSQHDIILGHKRRYSAESLRQLWHNLGVRELLFSSFNSVLFPPIALYRRLKRSHPESGKSDLHLPAPWLNFLLYKIFSAERAFIRRFPLPLGASYLALMRKEREDT